MPTREEMKLEAIRRLEMLNIYKPYINKFKTAKQIPTFFENFGGYYADQEDGLTEKIHRVEEDTGCMVYALTHERFEFGDCWTMLAVSKYQEEWPEELEAISSSCFYAWAWVENTTMPDCSEWGTVAVRSCFGGIRREG